ncbi:MAG: endonuclease III [Candidatus Peregrinibacteria bacterium]|nr:endonuclease III [Candidatus Peregrinibacteria bacterium]
MSDAKKNPASIIKLLKKQYPYSKIALDYGNLFQLVVAVILSAQCTDVRVNKVTPALFKRFPEVSDFAECDVHELEKLIYSTGFYKNKAKNIKGAAQKTMKDFGGKVPDTMEKLLSLPGVARKTANVVLSSGFGRNEGIVVDTHVARICGLLGLVPKKMSDAKNAVKIEKILVKLVQKKDWGIFSFLMIDHGRAICIARRPKCEICPLNKICPSSTV